MRCVLPFRVYTKKLVLACARVVAAYSRAEKPALLLAFSTLRLTLRVINETALFESTFKKLYNEFARETKIGGGGYQVQDRLRITQNCIVELLELDPEAGYRLGFQYIRLLCLHLKSARSAKSPADALKSVYSWQFYNCVRVWVLALTTASASELALLVHPLVQLLVGVVRLTDNLKYFPFHLKCFELLATINQRTG